MSSLAEGTLVYYNTKVDSRLEKRPIEELYRRYHAIHANIDLRMMNEASKLIQTTGIRNVYKGQNQEITKIILDDGKSIECGTDNKFLTDKGWKCAIECDLPVYAQDNRIQWSKIRKVYLVKIVMIQLMEPKLTYDLVVQGPYQNFIANGIVTQ